MNKEDRKLLIQKLAAKKNMLGKVKPAKKTSADDFIAYIDPSEQDINDELMMLDGYVSKNRK